MAEITLLTFEGKTHSNVPIAGCKGHVSEAAFFLAIDAKKPLEEGKHYTTLEGTRHANLSLLIGNETEASFDPGPINIKPIYVKTTMDNSTKFENQAYVMKAILHNSMTKATREYMLTIPQYRIAHEYTETRCMFLAMKEHLSSSLGAVSKDDSIILMVAMHIKYIANMKQGDQEEASTYKTRMDLKLDEIFALRSWEKDIVLQSILAGILFNGLNSDYDESLKYAIEHNGFKNIKTMDDANQMITQWEGHIKLTNELRSVSINNKSIKVTNTNSINNTNTINSSKMPPQPWMSCWYCNIKGDHFATHCPDLTDEQKVRLTAEREKMKKNNNKFNSNKKNIKTDQN